MKRLVYFPLLVVCLMVTQLASAQNYIYATGVPSFSTQIPVQNGFIDVNNGNLHLELSLVSHPQRGSLNLNERLVYDSRIWTIVQNGGASWQPTNVPNSAAGWRFTTGLETGTTSNMPTDFSYDTGEECQIGHLREFDATETWTTYSQFSWTDPQGTSHMFPINTSQPDFVCNGDTSHTSPNGSGYALDGSGYYATVSGYQNMTVFDPGGNEVFPQIIDRNGNYFSTDGNGNLIDTLGNTPVLVSTSGNQTYYDVLGTGGTRQRYTVTMSSIPFSTSFGQAGVSEASGTMMAVSQILLPDGSSYNFSYDSYGEVQSMSLPTGGTQTFGFTNISDGFGDSNRWIASKTTSDGTTSISTIPTSGCSPTSGCQADITVTTPAGDDTLYMSSVAQGSVANSTAITQSVMAFNGNQNNPGIQMVQAGTTLTYQTSQAADGTTYQLPTQVQQLTTYPQVSEQTQTITALANGFLPTSVSVWDFYSDTVGAPTNPTQITTTAYGYGVNGAAFTTSVTVTDGSSNQVSKATYAYDGSSLTATSGLPNHTSAPGASRGNQTSESQWINTSNSWLQSNATFDDAGTILSVATPLGTTAASHDSTDTFAQTVTPPTPSSGASLPVTTSFDGSSGVMLTSVAANSGTTTFQSFDMFDRPQQITYPDTGVENISYSQTQVTDTRDFDSHSVRSTSISNFDGYGRNSSLILAAGSQSYRSDTCYDSDGRVVFVSTPYINQGGANVCSGAGTAYSYDALNRVTQITKPDGSTVQKTYNGRAVQTVANGVTRVVQNNVFGQPTVVCEISSNTSLQGGDQPGACGTDISGTGFLTTYTYNLANHTTTVTQGAQARVFQTDSLNRPISLTEPESGITTYSYAYNSTGLLVTRSRPSANVAAPVTGAIPQTTTTTQYDNQGRVISISYSDGTPTKTFGYDVYPGVGALGYSQGSIVYANTQNSSGVIDQITFTYNIMGQPTATAECFPQLCSGTQNVNRSYGYNYASMMNQESYSTTLGGSPNVTLNYSYNVAGQLTSVSGGQNNAPGAPYIYSVSSMGAAGPTLAQLGNGYYVPYGYDAAGRLNSESVCTAISGNSCTAGTVYSFANTIQGSRIVSSTTNTVAQSSFGYDEFGRLASVSSGNSSVSPSMTFSYDRYGNRWAQSVTAGSGPQPQLSFNTATNQVSQVSGYTYDVAGNVIYDGLHQYAYDAENNLISIDNGSTDAYQFNALNQRVMEVLPAGTVRSGYDLNGRRVTLWTGTTAPTETTARYYAGNNKVAYWTSFDSNIHFEHQDWLGTDRVRTLPNGSVDSTLKSLPFGDAFTVTSGTNSDPAQYGQLDTDVKVALGLQHATFRDYHTTSGRWMSPDWFTGSYNANNPQSLNRYSYVMNKPTVFTDASGLCYYDGSDQTYDSNDNLLSSNYDPSDSTYCGGGFYAGAFGAALQYYGAQGGGGGGGTTDCAPAPATAAQYATATAAVGALVAQWATGSLGSGDVSFASDSAVSQVMAQSQGVQDVLSLYSITGSQSGLYTFGIPGLIGAKANPVAQFVGSFRWTISPTAGGINLTLTNTTSFKSASYDIGPQWQRHSVYTPFGTFGVPMGNTHQIYNLYVPCHS